MILNLPVDVLNEIGTQLTNSHRKNLRAACRDLNSTLEFLFFSSLVLRLGETDLLTFLSSGESGWSRWASTLRIIGGIDANDIHQDRSAARLGEALRSLKRLRTVIWNAPQSDPQWTRDTISAFLVASPGLCDIELDTEYSVEVPLGMISGLTRLKVTLPSYAGRKPKPLDLVSRIGQNIIHNRGSLTSLHLIGPGQFVELWALLASQRRQNQIQLKELTTNTITTDLLLYLASYSGLQRLNMLYPDGRTQAESNRLADTFFETVLPLHAASLVELQCSGCYESRWSFGTRCVDAISELHKVETLEMSVNFAGVDNAVTSLLHTAARLPALRALVVVGTDAEANRHARCGRPRMHHMAALDPCVNAAVRAFRTDTSTTSASASKATLRAGYVWYTLAPLSPSLEQQAQVPVEAHSANASDVLAYREFLHPDISWQRLRYLSEDD